MAEKTLIRINLDPAQTLARLDGIDEELAQRIVACRKSGYEFIGPEDLTQVEGIDLSMALRLSGEIDWESPQPSRTLVLPIRPQKHIPLNWPGAAFHSTSILVLFWLLVARVLPMLSPAITIGRLGQGWLMAYILSALMLAVLFMLLGSLTSTMLSLSRRPDRTRRGIRARSAFSLLAVASLLAALALSAVLGL